MLFMAVAVVLTSLAVGVAVVVVWKVLLYDLVVRGGTAVVRRMV